jgi:hypothetical protein|tara:strand:- start:19924 stop:20109 length:186 start_codon:yes stop_codon:yes gene_type:complete
MSKENKYLFDLDSIHTCILVNAYEVITKNNEAEEEIIKPVVLNIADLVCSHLKHWKDTGQV